MGGNILVVDDEEDIRDLISDILSDKGHTCFTAAESNSALDLVSSRKPDLVLLDIWLQGSELDGLGVLELINERYPSIPVIMISGHGNIETAVNAVKMGAYDYIEKPFLPDKLIHSVNNALENFRLRRENSELKKKYAPKQDLIGNSNAMNHLRSLLVKVAQTSSRVLITGEIGSGKSLVAKLIHKHSSRKNMPFVSINASIVEQETNGHLFGDPAENKFGVARVASGGTLYVEEIANLSLEMQKNLLKFIKIQPSSTDPKHGMQEVRVIASTSEDVKKLVDEGKFLQELYYRINVVSVEVPPLRLRKEDIITLCEYFSKIFERTEGLKSKQIGSEVNLLLQSYEWPGNVRELKNVLESLIIAANISRSERINLEHFDSKLRKTSKEDIPQALMIDVNTPDVMSMPLREAREEFEKQYLMTQMARFNNNISKTSIFVGMERSALHRKLKILEITTK